MVDEVKSRQLYFQPSAPLISVCHCVTSTEKQSPSPKLAVAQESRSCHIVHVISTTKKNNVHLLIKKRNICIWLSFMKACYQCRNYLFYMDKVIEELA